MTRIRSKAPAETPAETPVEALENSAPVERVPATEAEQTAPAEAQAETAAAADVVAVPVYEVSSPTGPRRRAGMAFGPAAVTLTETDLGPDAEATLERLRDDPMLRVTVRLVEQPVG